MLVVRQNAHTTAVHTDKVRKIRYLKVTPTTHTKYILAPSQNQNI